MSKPDKTAVDDLLKTMRKTKNEEEAERLALKVANIVSKYA